MKIPRTRKQSAPRNVAAKALRSGLFQPKVEPDPKKNYTRKSKHKTPPPVEDPEGEQS